MAAGNEVVAEPNDLLLVINRVFDAPSSLVFAAWTEWEHLLRWCAPHGFVITSSEGDVRPGGAWRTCMRSPDGVDHWVSGVYREIKNDERIVFTHTWDGKDGKPGHETLVTVTLAGDQGRTRLAFRQEVFKSVASRDGHEGGWRESFDRLGEYLRDLSPADREFVITRILDAPRELVFKAWTDPKRMSKWWGPHHFTNPICEMDVRPGVSWRIVMRGPDGSAHPTKGVYREVIPPERLVMTIDHSDLSEEWHDLVNPGRDKSKGKPAIEAVNTVTFDELDGKTKLTIRVRFDSAATLAAMLKIGMNEGWSQSLERLTTEVANLSNGEKP